MINHLERVHINSGSMNVHINADTSTFDWPANRPMSLAELNQMKKFPVEGKQL